MSLVYQYGLAPNYDKLQWDYLLDAWASGCDELGDEDLMVVCAGNAGVYRAAAAAFLFFVIFGEHVDYIPSSLSMMHIARFCAHIYFYDQA